MLRTTPPGINGVRNWPAIVHEVKPIFKVVDPTCWKKVKVNSYIPLITVHGTAESVLHFIRCKTCSFQRQLDFYGKHRTTLQLLRKYYSCTYPPLCITGYSFIQLSELEQRGVNKIAKVSKRSNRIRNRVRLVDSRMF